MAGQIGNRRRETPPLEIAWRCDHEPPCAGKPPADETRIGQSAESQGHVGALDDQIFVAVGHRQVDSQCRMPIEKGGQQRHDLADPKGGRESDPQRDA